MFDLLANFEQLLKYLSYCSRLGVETQEPVSNFLAKFKLHRAQIDQVAVAHDVKQATNEKEVLRLILGVVASSRVRPRVRSHLRTLLRHVHEEGSLFESDLLESLGKRVCFRFLLEQEIH